MANDDASIWKSVDGVLLDEKKYAAICALDYYERLCSGRSLGSGQVEGACKRLVGRRLKQTWALTFAAVVILDINQWEKYWNY